MRLVPAQGKVRKDGFFVFSGVLFISISGPGPLGALDCFLITLTCQHRVYHQSGHIHARIPECGHTIFAPLRWADKAKFINDGVGNTFSQSLLITTLEGYFYAFRL